MRRTALAAATALALIAPWHQATPASAATFGLVIGINDYQSDRLRDLGGAVNDAEDIYRALRTMGADDITKLIDRQATREAILSAWGDIIAKAKPGDTVILTYAGHGAQQTERVAGTEADGRDEFFQLSGYAQSGPGTGERILDDELNRLFKDASHLRIIVVADSCHSGTMTRSFDPRGGGGATRGGDFDIIDDDSLPPATSEDASIDEAALEHVLFFGAVKDSQLVVELPIENQMRGALSWAFANALRGAADKNRDSVLYANELEVYLRETVRVMSEGRQLPQTARRPADDEVALLLSGVHQANADAAQADGSVRLGVIGASDGEALVAQLRDARFTRGGVPDLVWDVAKSEVISGAGDIVARLPANAMIEDIQAIIDKWAVLRRLRQVSGADPLSLRFRGADTAHTPEDVTGAIHPEGTALSFELTGHSYRHITVINLAMDGKVQYLIPVPNHSQAHYRGLATPGQPYEFPLQVQGPGPFGAEHLIVISSAERRDDLHAGVLEIDQQPKSRELGDLIEAHLGGKEFQAGYVTLFSGAAE